MPVSCLLLTRTRFLFFINFTRSFAAQIHVSLFLVSLPFFASVSSGLRKSLISSSHLFLGLPTTLHVLILALRPGFHSAGFFAHLFSGNDAILIASRHSILLCVSIQHGMLAFFIGSSALAVLLFMYSTHSSVAVTGQGVCHGVDKGQDQGWDCGCQGVVQ